MGQELDFDLLARYVADELDREERLRVEEWALESEKNQERLMNLEKIWHMSGLGQRFDSNDGWRDLQLDLEEPTVTRTIQPIWQQTIRIAATLTILIAVGWLIVMNLRDSGKQISAFDQVLAHTLDDGSVVTLNAGSELILEPDFGQDSRMVHLSGEGYFDVEKGNQPFVVRVNDIEIRVVGTEFNIRQEEALGLRISVFEGIVTVAGRGQQLRLEAGDMVTVDDDQGFIQQPASMNDLFWMTGRLTFQNIPLEQAITEISTKYNRLIALDPDTRNCFITTEFDQTPLEEVLEILSAMYNLEILEQQGVILLSGPGCE